MIELDISKFLKPLGGVDLFLFSFVVVVVRIGWLHTG